MYLNVGYHPNIVTMLGFCTEQGWIKFVINAYISSFSSNMINTELLQDIIIIMIYMDVFLVPVMKLSIPITLAL